MPSVTFLQYDFFFKSDPKCLKNTFFSTITLCTLLWKQMKTTVFQTKILFFHPQRHTCPWHLWNALVCWWLLDSLPKDPGTNPIIDCPSTRDLSTLLLSTLYKWYLDASYFYTFVIRSIICIKFLLSFLVMSTSNSMFIMWINFHPWIFVYWKPSRKFSSMHLFAQWLMGCLRFLWFMMIRHVRVQILIWFQTFLLFTKPPFSDF